MSLKGDLRSGPAGLHTGQSTAPAYEVGGLSRRYAPGVRPALCEVGFTVAPAEMFGVLGRNGAGKSTLVRHLVGLLRPQHGTVRLLGADVGTDPGGAATRVAYLPQTETALTDMTVRVAVETTARLRGLRRRPARAHTAELLDELGLGPIADRRMGRLSGGQRRLAAVATALAADRPVLVLDEPTTGLDVDARRAVWSALARRRDTGATVVLVTHNVTEADTVLDRVLILDHGRVGGCDTPGRLKQRLGGEVRLDLTWRADPPRTLPPGADQAVERTVRTGRRWSLRLPADEATRVLTALLNDPASSALDDFSLTTVSLEDVVLAGDQR